MITITGLNRVECDVYHVPLCYSVLLQGVFVPSITSMPSSSNIAADRAAGSAEWGLLPGRESAQKKQPRGFQIRPLQVTWEMTKACEWKSGPARATVRAARETQAVSTAEAFHLVDEVSSMHVPLFTLTGGDPLLRPDLFPIIEFAAARSVRTSLTLLPTTMLEDSVIGELKACGLMRVGFWLHGSTAPLHDGCSGIPGSHRRTTEIIGKCHEEQLPVQINTILSRRNFHDLEPMLELLTRLDVALWNVIFLVPEDRDHADDMLDAAGHEQIFAKLYQASKRVHFQIKTAEAQHYQRYLLQQRARESRGKLTAEEVITCAPKGTSDGKGFVFIDHKGDVRPSRYLPLSAGNIMDHPLSELFCDSPLFVSLRDSSKLKGKCARCPVRNVCGGSRARAYAMTGDLFAAEPCCAYEA